MRPTKQILYGLYTSHGCIVRDSIGTTAKEVEAYTEEQYGSLPINWEIAKITVTPELESTND